ncbi:MAG: class A beta-lactamase, subclass A2 [Bacteroidota bacterium]|nr:class A beta-lactamase, subclass A2 [Bacteroidota bacterium]
MKAIPSKKNKTAYYVFLSLFFLFNQDVFAQTGSLRQEIEKLISNRKADIGVSIKGIEQGDTLSIQGDKSFPLESVFKFPIALYVLSRVDLHALSLDQKIPLRKQDVLPKTWSPIRDKYPNGGVSLPIDTILQYMVSESDNLGCDLLLKQVGGPLRVHNYVRQLGVPGFVIKVNEKTMHRGFDMQRINTATPKAATQLLTLFYHRRILSQKSHDHLMEIMYQTSTGSARIKGQLPPGTPVAHKTGTSDTNKEGLTLAVNDIGIVTLPNGNHFVISVFVSNSRENEETNDKIISDIARLTWDYFTRKTSNSVTLN